MSRRRKSKITYNSRETQVALGLSFLLVAFVLVFATLDDSKGDNLFTLLRLFFGQTIAWAAFASLNLGLFFLNINYVFSKATSVIAQSILVFLYPTFLASLNLTEAEAIRQVNVGLGGGRLGYFIAWDIFFDRPFANLTPHIVGAACIILLMLVVSVSLDQIGKFVSNLFSFLMSMLGYLKGTGEMVESALETNPLEVLSAKRLSDFRKGDDEPEVQDEQKPKTDNPIEQKLLPDNAQHKNFPAVNISEAEAGDSGLFAEELKYPEWQLPPLSLLNPYKKLKPSESDAERSSKIIEQLLRSFQVDARVAEVYVGPSVVRYALDIPLGIKVAKVSGLAENLALGLGLAANQIRIEPIEGTTYLGIETPRSKRDVVTIRELCEELEKKVELTLGVTIGKDINGRAILGDIKKMPHLLIAGATGSGKSVLTNAFITSLLMRRTPDELKLILVDPKQVELQDYNGIPHLLTPVITDMAKVVNALKWCVAEMEARYTKFAEAKVRNIAEYNDKCGFAAVPYIVVVIDEMADMMLTADRGEAETAIVRLAQKARATGIHLILATQRPSVNVITGIIKANIPGRVGMSVTSNTDSRVILDAIGAESLLGNGDLLYKAPDKTKSERVQAPLITQAEIGRIVSFIKSQAPEVSYINSILEKPPGEDSGEGMFEGVSDDDLFTNAVRIVVNYKKGSSSFLQRKLNIGFNRAARLLEEMEEAGVVGEPNGSKPREVLVDDAEAFLTAFRTQKQG